MLKIHSVTVGEGNKVHGYMGNDPDRIWTICGIGGHLRKVSETINCKKCLKLVERYKLDKES